MIFYSVIWAFITIFINVLMTPLTGMPVPSGGLEVVTILIVYTIVFYLALKYNKET